jgi:hypothetical protein
MKAMAAKEDQFLTDAKGKRTGVLPDLHAYEHLCEAEEELADIRAYGSARGCAPSEIPAGQFPTTAAYRAAPGRKAK